MALKSYRFVGLDRDVWLPDDITVEIAIVPANMTNIRSNQYFTGQNSYTEHETANFAAGANADMHKRWLHGGAGGASVGFNFVVDDRKIIQLTPLNEVTWAAGTPDGNRYSYHTELCVNNDINHTLARRNAAALAGGIMAAKGWTIDRLFQHNVWWGKDCPYLLRRNGLWPVFVNQVAAFMVQAKAGAGGSVPTSSPTAFKVGDTLKVLDALNARGGDATTYPVIKVLQPGETVKVIADNSGSFVKNNGGYTWYNIAFGGGTGWAVADYLEKVAPPAAEVPKAGWPYPAPVVPAFWSALMAEGATHVFDSGYLWIRSNALYEVKTGGAERLRYADESGEEVGPVIPAGTRVRLVAVGQSGVDKKAYGITEGHTRISLDDVKFVSEV